LVFIHFPQDETGKQCKLSRPWHGPYQITSCDDPDIATVKVFFPTDPFVQVHQSRVIKCPPTFLTDVYWYGGKRSKLGRPPKRMQKQLEEIDAEVEHLYNDSSIECEYEDQTNSQLSGDMLPVPNNVCTESSKSSKIDRKDQTFAATARKKDQTSTKRTQKGKQLEPVKCPYSLKSCQKSKYSDNNKMLTKCSGRA